MQNPLVCTIRSAGFDPWPRTDLSALGSWFPSSDKPHSSTLSHIEYIVAIHNCATLGAVDIIFQPTGRQGESCLLRGSDHIPIVARAHLIEGFAVHI